MIEKVIEYSVRNPLVIIVAALALAAVGFYSLVNTPVDAIPDLSENQVIVFADWPGRSPREVEDQVTYPLAVNLQGLAGVKAVRANSEFGFSMVNIIFEDDVDFYFARERVLERLSVAATFLPEGVIAYMAPDATALGQIYWYTVEGEGVDPGRLRAIQDWFVRYQLQSVPGVAEVASVGGYPLEYQVDVDPGKLRAFDVTLGELDMALSRANSSVGGRVIQKANSEYLVRSVGWIESLDDVRNIVVKSRGGTPVYVSNVATVQFGPGMRRASLEKNGSEAVGGVVLMRYGENPLTVTERIKEKILRLQPGLPEGVRIVPFYERTELIRRAIGTVTGTLLEEMLVASAAIIFILWHFRTALIVCVTLPLAVLISFILMRVFGMPSNIMSLSGIAISIGVLVDSSIVMVENATHRLHRKYGSEPVKGDTREFILPALRSVGRPIFFSVMVMLISFIPVFALSGMEGRMFHPLAFTKTFAMVGVAILAVTLVPALVPLLIRGRLRGEQESWLVRSVLEIYRPVLSYLLDHPWPIVLVTGLIFVVGAAPTGSSFLFRFVIACVLGACAWAAAQGPAGRATSTFSWLLRTAALAACVLVVAFLAERNMRPLGREFMPPLDEGTILDMPVTHPRASITQVSDDLKVRNAVTRSFPEVSLVVGKAGRAETPTDPSPLDMVETIVNLRPLEHWPKRELRREDADRHVATVFEAMQSRGWIAPARPGDAADLVHEAILPALERFDIHMRDRADADYARFEQALAPELVQFAVKEAVEMLVRNGKLDRMPAADEVSAIAEALAPKFGPALATSPDLPAVAALAQKVADAMVARKLASPRSDMFVLDEPRVVAALREAGEVVGLARPTFFSQLLASVESRRHERWTEHVRLFNWQLLDAAAPAITWLAIDELRQKAADHNRWPGEVPQAELVALRAELERPLAGSVMLWPRSRETLLEELDAATRMPGWGNIWTQPIINRIDMLATGVRTMIGVKVFGSSLDQIQEASNEIAQVVRKVPGAANVVADQVRGEGYLQIDIDRRRAARYGVQVGDIQDVVETALGGKVATMTVEGRERFPVRIRYARAFRQDEESVKNLLVEGSALAMESAAAPAAMSENEVSPLESAALGTGGLSAAGARPGGMAGMADGGAAKKMQIPLAQVADVRIVEGPSMIKSENGLLVAYVQLSVRGRDVVGFVEEARQAVAREVTIPAGMYVEWTGQFEHQVRAGRTLVVILPLVVLIIFMVLYVTYHDLGDALLMMLAVPGAVFGGVLFQYLWGFNFSVAVWVGFIACFGLATETGVVMLVYLREAVAERGELADMEPSDLHKAIMEGAVHRLRPKLLTELTTIVGLAPMLWAEGTGSELMRPMAAPVLGGILVADEVIDLLLPVLFYRLRLARRAAEQQKKKKKEKESEEAVTA